jgi:hypothetical protein
MLGSGSAAISGGCGMIKSFNDRATTAATAILQIVADAELEPDLVPGELQYRICRYLRDEFDDIARQMAAGQPEKSMSSTYDMGRVTAVPDLRGAEFEDAVDAVVTWFFANFEDPAEATPWDEGEYVFIWGGPYDAREEIDAAFASIDEKVIDAAVERIEQDGWEWAPSQSRIIEVDDIPGGSVEPWPAGSNATKTANAPTKPGCFVTGMAGTAQSVKPFLLAHTGQCSSGYCICSSPWS